MTRITSLLFSAFDEQQADAAGKVYPFKHRSAVAAGTQRALRTLGVETGQWLLQASPVSSTPQLTYARELLALQARFGTVLTDRSCWRPGHQAATQAHPHAGPEAEAEHRHGEVELRVLLAGQLRYTLHAPALGGHLVVDVEPGDWIALPAGLPHRLQALGHDRVDMLRLFASRGGWRAHATAHATAPGAGRGPSPARQRPNEALAA